MHNTGEAYVVQSEHVAQSLEEITAAGSFDLRTTYEDIACADCFA